MKKTTYCNNYVDAGNSGIIRTGERPAHPWKEHESNGY